MSFSSPSPQWATFLDVQNDVVPYMQYPPDRADQAALLQDITDMACFWVQDYLGQPVAPTTFDRRFNGWQGWNGAYVMLPYFPVLEIVSVTEWWGGSGPHNVVEQTPSQQQVGADSYQLDTLKGMLIRTFPGLVQKPWFPGSRNIEVVWVAGYNPIPPTIRIAARELINHWYRNTQEAPRTFRQGLQEYDGPEAGQLWPAIPHRVMTLLQTYVQIGIA